MRTKHLRTVTKRIGDAAAELDLEPHVLRYWETEFPQLKPIRTSSGQRLYDDSHMALLRHIQDLLHTQGMTIDGARRMLTALLSNTAPDPITEHKTTSHHLHEILQDIYNELNDIQGLLNPTRLQKTNREPS